MLQCVWTQNTSTIGACSIVNPMGRTYVVNTLRETGTCMPRGAQMSLALNELIQTNVLNSKASHQLQYIK